MTGVVEAAVGSLEARGDDADRRIVGHLREDLSQRLPLQQDVRVEEEDPFGLDAHRPAITDRRVAGVVRRCGDLQPRPIDVIGQ